MTPKRKTRGKKLLKPKEECVRLQKGDVRDLKRLKEIERDD